MERLKRDGVTLKYIFETHFHADFVSGHIDLSKLTGAPIIYGPNANPGFQAVVAKDRQVFEFGQCKIVLLHTPGHTLESSVLVLINEAGKEVAAFTGDTLFIGDVGRPDLAQNSEISQEDLAGMLFDSLRNKIMNLPKDIVIYPAHGAGSACGKNMSTETNASLENQLQFNYALRENMSKKEFIQEVLSGLTAPPEYFVHNVNMNKSGYKEYQEISSNLKKGLNADQFQELLNDKSIIVLDTRNANDFYRKFIPGSLNIGLSGDFAPWVGAILGNVNQRIALVTAIGTEEETIMRLSRIGFDNVVAYLEGGFDSWIQSEKPTDHIFRISADQYYNLIESSDLKTLDLRKESEFENDHLEEAVNLPLQSIHNWSDDLDTHKNFVIHCAGGYRSMIAASILKAKGFNNFYEIDGGFKALKQRLPTQSI